MPRTKTKAAPPPPSDETLYFATPAEWRRWLERHHERATEVWVGFHRKGTGVPGMTWPEAVDEALCFGWIDGIRKRVDGTRYRNRFTPRKPTSNWSAVNIARVAALTAEGRMRPAGLAAFARRSAARSGVYSFEQPAPPALTAEQEAELQENAAAWAYWSARPPGWRRAVAHWVNSAKREETRRRRMATLVECSAQGRPVPPMAY